MRKSSVVEVLFPLILFTFFVMGAFFILISGANGYSKMINSFSNNEEGNYPLAYIATKVRSATNRDCVYLDHIDGVDCLLIEEEINGKMMDTCIFYKDGGLYELYTKKEKLNLDFAEKLFDVSDFSFSYDEHSISFITIDSLGEEYHLILSRK